MYAGALFIKYLLGWDIYISSVILLILTAIYTIAGGLSTVMWTDTVQAAIIILGTSAVAILSKYVFNIIVAYNSHRICGSCPLSCETVSKLINCQSKFTI